MILSRIVTLPITYGILFFLSHCRLNKAWWRLTHMRLAVLPRSMYLVPFVWLASVNTLLRKPAAGVAVAIKVAPIQGF